MHQNRVLVVIDHLDPLLTADGQWRDGRWDQVVTALCAPAGLGRVVLNRRQPASLDAAIQAEAVETLSVDETVLLAHQLPDPAKLIKGTVPGIDPRAGRILARRVLAISQGHPTLLELADGQAARPEALRDLIDAGTQAWPQSGGSWRGSSPGASPTPGRMTT